ERGETASKPPDQRGFQAHPSPPPKPPPSPPACGGASTAAGSPRTTPKEREFEHAYPEMVVQVPQILTNGRRRGTHVALWITRSLPARFRLKTGPASGTIRPRPGKFLFPRCHARYTV